MNFGLNLLLPGKPKLIIPQLVGWHHKLAKHPGPI